MTRNQAIQGNSHCSDERVVELLRCIWSTRSSISLDPDRNEPVGNATDGSHITKRFSNKNF